MADKMNDPPKKGGGDRNMLVYLAVYFFGWLGGLIGLLMAGNDKTMKFHGIQSLLWSILLIVIYVILGIIFTIIFVGSAAASYANPYAATGAVAAAGTGTLVVSLIAFLMWLYALYVGFQAGNGSDMEMPLVGGLAKSWS